MTVVFATCTAERAEELIRHTREVAPDGPLLVVSEFPPSTGQWLPYRIGRTFGQNLARCRAALAGRRIHLASLLLEAGNPYWQLRLIALRLAAARLLFFNEHFGHFMLRPRSLEVMARHVGWRAKSALVFQLRPGGDVYTWLWRLAHPRALRRPWWHLRARAAGLAAAGLRRDGPRVEAGAPPGEYPDGISVVIPSRNGRELLARLLPGLLDDLAGKRAEVIVVDNGSTDGTAAGLAAEYPDVRVAEVAAPLAFASAVNAGIRMARYSHVCLLNNDMVVEPGFSSALAGAFRQVPALFAATAQILFPPGARREETGKAVLAARRGLTDFPLRCDEPLPGEDLSYVLYGSGGCSLYDHAKLDQLELLDETYWPVYVEDLDLGYRAWLGGWPTVYVAEARVHHLHRSTTKRYFTDEALERITEVNYLRFVARAVRERAVFGRLWREAVTRLNHLAAREGAPAQYGEALAAGWRLPFSRRRLLTGGLPEDEILAAGSGDVAVFPGRAPRHPMAVLVASCYLPYPLSHGGAVRMYNLMRRAAAGVSQILVCFAATLEAPPPELLEICVEVVLVRRTGSHALPLGERPEVVDEFDSAAFRAALRLMVQKWSPAVVQLEFTQMAQYAAACAPAKTVMVEHDITIDLYRQLAAGNSDWELRQQLRRWEQFETAAWRQVDAVVTMSRKDAAAIQGARRVVCLENGVDCERFQPSGEAPEPRRLLFIGSFAHLPNLLALEWFLREVWPLLAEWSPVLHVIAGSRHTEFLHLNKDRVAIPWEMAGIEVEGFVADVRPAYRRAEVVIAPLRASAGTNLKILEAMAMGKAIVSTPSGVNGLEVADGHDVVIADSGAAFARALTDLFADPAQRRAREAAARERAVGWYGWERIAGEQQRMYEQLRQS